MEQDQHKRLLLALALSFGVTLLYMAFFGPKPPTRTDTTGTDGGQVVAQAAPTAAPSGADAGVVMAAPEAALPEATVSAAREDVHYTFTSEGGGLSRAELQGPKMREAKQVSLVQGWKRLVGGDVEPAPQIDMAHLAPSVPPTLAISLEGPNGLPATTRYRVVKPAEQDTTVTMETQAQGWAVKKTVAWEKSGFELLYTVAVTNTGSSAFKGELGVTYARGVDSSKEEAPSMFGAVGNQSSATCRVEDKSHKVLPKDDAHNKEEFAGALSFFGVDHQYFLGAIYPAATTPGRCVLNATATGRWATAYIPVSIGPGETLTQKFGVYIGPKDLDLLAAVPSLKIPGAEGAIVSDPELETSVDFGIWAFICRVLLAILKFFYGVFHNWGVAIIMLTVVVKVVLLPLTHKSMVSAEQMKKLQPKIEELKKKFPDDRERQSMEMMKLYQENKVNPLSGCLPLLLQMPVWIALFTTLRNSYEIYGEPFISPIWMDLTSKDPTYILPVALGVTMIITQRLQPQMMDATQAKIMTYLMPVVFTALMLNYPAGLSLYIFTNNILTIVQQYGLKKLMVWRTAQ